MQPDDYDIHLLRTHWQAETAPAGLAERIIRHARSMPQHQPWHRRATAGIANSFTEWNTSLAFKGVVLAGFLVLGMMSNINTTTSHEEIDFLTGGSDLWTEEL